MSATAARDDPLHLLTTPPTHQPYSPSPTDPIDSYLTESSGSFQNSGGFLGDSIGASGEDYGFTRPDFRKLPLVGTVEKYDRHVFLCYKNPQVWPQRIEAAEFDRLPRLLSAAMAAKKGDMNRVTRLTICEGHDGTETSNGDVLIFPDMVRYRRLTHFDVETFVEEVLVKNGEWSPGSPEPLTGWYVFVCCHGARDRRCGVCGPSIVSKFKNEIESCGLQGKVSVSPCSHVGGHQYAGNVLIFGPNADKKVTGHWYGYVTPEDVTLLLEQHVGKGEIVDFLWRGQMGLSEEEQIKAHELRSQAYGGIDKNNAENSSSTENSPNCCQGNGSSVCCQKQTSKEKKRGSVSTEAVITTEKKKGSKKQYPISNSLNPRKVCSMPTWYECWEREDTYAALTVIGAVISVAFAYNCYRQLK